MHQSRDQTCRMCLCTGPLSSCKLVKRRHVHLQRSTTCSVFHPVSADLALSNWMQRALSACCPAQFSCESASDASHSSSAAAARFPAAKKGGRMKDTLEMNVKYGPTSKAQFTPFSLELGLNFSATPQSRALIFSPSSPASLSVRHPGEV